MMMEPEYEYSVSDLGFSTNVTLTDLRATKDFWELCNSDGQEETKRFERIREKRDDFIQDLREKRHKRWDEGHNMPSITNYNESGSHNIISERKLLGKKMNLKLSSMPGIILNPIDKTKYEKALENILISKMRRVGMFPEDDADDHEEDSLLETWNYKDRERVMEKREKEKIDKEPRLVFLKNTKEMIGVNGGENVLPANTIFSHNSDKCAQNSENLRSEKNKLHKAKQLWERKWKSSEYFPKIQMRCQATTSSSVKTSENMRKSGPDLCGVLVCKRVSGDMENRSELVNKIIEDLFPMDNQNPELTQKETSAEKLHESGTETVPENTAGHSKTGPEEGSNHVRQIPKPINIKLRLTSRDRGKRRLVTSQQEGLLTKNGDLPEQTTSEPSLSMVCLKKLFPNAKLELY